MTVVTISVLLAEIVEPTTASGESHTRHLEILRAAIAEAGGIGAEHSASTVIAVFLSLGGALDGAIAMQRSVELDNRSASDPFAIRVGLSSGDATEYDGHYEGEPVVEAQRLCAMAGGGQIVSTEMVQLLARRTDHRFRSLGDRDLGGEAVEICELEWTPVGAMALAPLPRRLAAVPAAGVVGRALESDQLLAALKTAVAGNNHRLVLLSGEPGIGKTTLSSHLAQRAYSDGATVLYGRADEDLHVPYQPFVEALGDFVRNADHEVLARFDERNLSELSRLVPPIRGRIPTLAEPPSTDADAERHRLFAAVTSTLAELAVITPVLLVLDDLHWADKPTVLLLRHLVATLADARVLIVGTYRDSELTATHPLTEGLTALRTDASVERIPVGGLDDGAVVALLEGMAGHEMDTAGIDLAHAVRRETDGNPFFTGEMLRYLAETDAIRREDGRWIATANLDSIGLPESVREVVGQRVRSLGDDAQHTLTLASVIGRDFDFALLARIAERDRSEVRSALDAATEALIVTAVDGAERFTFNHVLFQRTLYDDLSASRRARTHRRIGEILEDECGDDPGDRIGELAHHWMAATKLADTSKAAGYAHRAGEQALSSLAPDEAIRWFRQAVELLEAESTSDPKARLDALIGLGDAQRQAGDAGFRETLLDAAAAAESLGDNDRLVAAALANQRGMVSGMGMVDQERIDVLEKALDAQGDTDTSQHALLLATLAAELSFTEDAGRFVTLAIDAEAMARRIGDEAPLLRVLNLAFLPLWWPENFARTMSATEEALELADRVGDPVAKFWAAMHRTIAMANAVDRAGMDAALALASSLAEDIGLPFPKCLALQAQCAQVLVSGDADEADRLGMEALQIGMATGQPDALMMFGANLMGVRWHQGRLSETLPLIEQAAADNPGLPAFMALRALVLCESGMHDDARPLLEMARAADFHRLANGSISPTTTSLWAEVAALLGDVDAAATLYERMAPYEVQGVAAGGTFTGTVGMFLARLAAVLGRQQDALDHFEQADRQVRALGAPFWQASNQVEWARLLIVRNADGDLARAREMLRDAEAIAATYGCGGVQRRAQELAGGAD